MKLEDYGYRHPFESNNRADCIPARITAVHRDRFEVVCDHGAGLAHLKTGAYRTEDALWPTTGDFVLLQWQPDGESRIVQTLPRKTYFSRRDPSCAELAEQAVAANFDYVFILQSMNRDFNPRRLERYLALAWQSGAVPAVILTKADMVDGSADYVRTVERLATGVGVFPVSARTGEGLGLLADYLRPGKTIVFLGSSGVGKSTLVNALAGREVMRTHLVREGDDRGRHTTSHRQLLRLDSGVLVIDTPGMRELGMWDAGEGLAQGFGDVTAYLGRCKFSDCSHRTEPGCAIRAAIRSGELSPDRWESYQRLETESRYTEDKAGYLRAKQQWHKDIVKQLRARQETGYRHESCAESFTCQVCGRLVTPDAAGTHHRNHCPYCLASVHLDHQPGDRASLCKAVMDPIGVWVRKDGEWALIHRCRGCGTLRSNRIAADDNMQLLRDIAARPMAQPPEPQWGNDDLSDKNA